MFVVLLLGRVRRAMVLLSLPKSVRPELVEGLFFSSTPSKKNGASTSSARTDGENRKKLSPEGSTILLTGTSKLVAPIGGAAHDAAMPELALIPTPRSEEHTSELQSLMRISYAVFCLK